MQNEQKVRKTKQFSCFFASEKVENPGVTAPGRQHEAGFQPMLNMTKASTGTVIVADVVPDGNASSEDGEEGDKRRHGTSLWQKYTETLSSGPTQVKKPDPGDNLNAIWFKIKELQWQLRELEYLVQVERHGSASQASQHGSAPPVTFPERAMNSYQDIDWST